jgi:4a-hydroxytetrahydrobiopterin dehydratase
MALKDKKCVPCEGGVNPMTDKEEESYMEHISSWNLDRDGVHKISKEFTFGDFKEAMRFVNKMADIAEDEGHHPNFTVEYNKVKTELFTHAINGLSENDFIMAAKIDEAV